MRSIAESLVQIAENEQRVYDAGFSKGHTLGSDEGFAVGKDIGAQNEQDRFWESYQGGTKQRTNYSYGFAGTGWKDETYNPKYPITATSSANYMFSYTGITNTKVPIDLGTDRSQKVSVFDNATLLVTIPELIIGPNIRISNTMFTNCKELKEISITGTIGYTASWEWCPLNGASIRSIVRALSTTTSGYTVTFNKAAKEAAFTQAEWDELIATKPNWTFALV